MAASPYLKGPRARSFTAIQACLIPLYKELSPAQQEESLRLVNHMLARQAPGQRLKLGLFLRVIDALSLLRCGRPFRKAPASVQSRIMAFLFDGPVGLFRKGFWGLNTLAKLGIYGQDSLYERIHYRQRPLP